MPYSTKVTEAKTKQHSWRWVLHVFAGLIISMIGCLLSTQSVGSNRLLDNVSVLQWIGFAIGIATNIFAICAAYLGIRKLLGLIKHRDGKPTIGRILSAVGLCIFAYAIYIVIHGILGAGNHFTVWDYLILFAIWAAIWKAVVGKKGNDNKIQEDTSLTNTQKITCVILPISFATISLLLLLLESIVGGVCHVEDSDNTSESQSLKSNHVADKSDRHKLLDRKSVENFEQDGIPSFLGVRFGDPVSKYSDSQLKVWSQEFNLMGVRATKNFRYLLSFNEYDLIVKNGIVVGIELKSPDMSQEESLKLFRTVVEAIEKKYHKTGSDMSWEYSKGCDFCFVNSSNLMSDIMVRSHIEDVRDRQ